MLAQNPQTAVDIGIRTLDFEKGQVRLTIARKDPAGSTPAREVRARVATAAKGQAPFYTTEVSLKPGALLPVMARYPGSGPSVVFVATVTPIGFKELAQFDNRRESMAYKMSADKPLRDGSLTDTVTITVTIPTSLLGTGTPRGTGRVR